MTGSGNGTTTVTITTPPISTNNSSTNLNNNTSIINNNTTQQLHIQTAPIQNNINNNSSNNNNNNTVTINANNGIKKKRFSLNILNVKPSGADSSDDVEAESITFAPSVVTPSVKEESVAPWQTVTEAIQEIPADYIVDQSCELVSIAIKKIINKLKLFQY